MDLRDSNLIGINSQRNNTERINSASTTGRIRNAYSQR